MGLPREFSQELENALRGQCPALGEGPSGQTYQVAVPLDSEWGDSAPPRAALESHHTAPRALRLKMLQLPPPAIFLPGKHQSRLIFLSPQGQATCVNEKGSHALSSQKGMPASLSSPAGPPSWL